MADHQGQGTGRISPKAAVIMIGTNNVGGHAGADAEGDRHRQGARQKPHMKILLLGVFPRVPAPASTRRPAGRPLGSQPKIG
ncbi:MAG: hypothetical protein U0736_14405 [Gemmataceae bacterium]